MESKSAFQSKYRFLQSTTLKLKRKEKKNLFDDFCLKNSTLIRFFSKWLRRIVKDEFKIKEIQYLMIDLFSNRLKSNFTLKVIEEIIIKKKNY